VNADEDAPAPLPALRGLARAAALAWLVGLTLLYLAVRELGWRVLP
jgi:hypothetical protein